ncbi:hypothetical protein R3Q06_31575 [Rhodococcus erythropolis]|uniref:hypothetical protein n=1 Tax=Rhodococcus erythropolis TaxID=1833 RepID=UPI00294A8488|nr:hypothetical protein [Rhodococcus erythropolis]MDV6278026.1 hypothetical protein [Rhodococcus erythropolis]
MTQQHTPTSTPHRKALRTMLGASLAVGLAAAAVASIGAGIGTAATADPSSPATTREWSVTNYTDQDLTDGTVRKHETGNASVINLYGGLARGGTRTGSYEVDPRNDDETSARICYNRQLWETPYVLTRGEDWREVYIYALDDGKGGKKLLLTRRGAGDNRLLNNTHIAC